MNYHIKTAFICIGGFFAAFLPLYLFADAGLSPFYGVETSLSRPVVAASASNYDVYNNSGTGPADNHNPAEPYDEESQSTETAISDRAIPGGETVTSDTTGGNAVVDTESQNEETIVQEDRPEVYRIEPQDVPKVSQELSEAIGDSVGDANFEAREEGNTIILSFWEDGLSNVVKKGRNGSLQNRSNWLGTQAVYVALCNAIKSRLVEKGSKQHIEIDIVDENDHSKQFLKIVDGDVIYEILRDTQSDNTAVQNTASNQSSNDLPREYTFEIEQGNGATVTLPRGTKVWLSATGEKFHNKQKCGNMDPNRAREVNVEECEADYQACKNCYGN